ncbi:acyl-CoA thioesterase II [Paeniglutamicibacter gangotriensis]|uniref:Acyl-CoA thioesterase II n=1 Tax=Paeniglutamicibacter gangotriensis TaxID=254787 RepID=A0A5B0EBN0_9MICC|nr:acyl-CoA thioesterase domain-containing protein [Paeniglutamicibacter gangotriensis]KAA0976283.1 acyl-CoA thioesterase II [Paeniglutamicibacter gangotriensis]
MSSQIFLDAIDLTACEAEVFDTAFTAIPQHVPWPKAYGGDMVAQGASAMMRSVTDDREMHSMHSYFLRPVDMHVPVRYEVELMRDGRGYSTRQVRGFQNSKAVYTSMGSFHVPEEGREHASTAPAEYLDIDPEALASAAEILAESTGPAADYWSTGRSFDMRHVPSPLYLNSDGVASAHQAVWVKAFTELPDDAITQRAALAYVCDYTILEPLLRTQDLSWSTEGLITASLDHSMWFHRAGRVDQWVLYVQEAVSSQNSRGLALGRFYTREGALLATVAQEGMIRAPRG